MTVTNNTPPSYRIPSCNTESIEWIVKQYGFSLGVIKELSTLLKFRGVSRDNPFILYTSNGKANLQIIGYDGDLVSFYYLNS